MRESSGRVISVSARLGDQRYNFVNVYTPTDPAERRNFFDNLPNYLFPRILLGLWRGILIVLRVTGINLEAM